MKDSQNIAIIILAGGASSRMDATKQLLPWNDTTLLGNAIRRAQNSQAETVVTVLGANAASIRKKIQEDVVIVENTNWTMGLGSSIACGTKYLLKGDHCPGGILVLLADQPLIDSDYLNELIAAFAATEKGIIATAYENSAGVPALFSPAYFEKLTELDDDFGAKKIIADTTDDILVIDPGSRTADIDTREEYDTIIGKSG